MDNLFTPEVIQQFLEILTKATEGSVIVLVTYFMLPLLMLLVTSCCWLIGVYQVVKHLSSNLTLYLNREKVMVNKYNISDKFITHNGEHALFIELINDLKGASTYIHGSDINYLQTALNNQRCLDKLHKGSKQRPYKVTDNG